jgi:hypothetical protein
MAKGKDLSKEFKEEYASLGELLESVPQDVLFFKRNVEIKERRTQNLHDLLVILYRMHDKDPNSQHYSDRCVAFMRIRGTGVMKRVDQVRLRKELAEILVKHLDPKSFIDDYVLTLISSNILSAEGSGKSFPLLCVDVGAA